MGTNVKVWPLAGVLIVTLLGIEGCNRNGGPDPANANLAPVDQNTVAENPAAADQYGQQLVEAPLPPPPLPEYSQPPCPGENYIWTPGYWSYSEAGYYWVPGAWVLAPYVGVLWTPPYWDFYGGRYRWHPGYWARHIGYYGGINYGFGYTGLGFYGGYWNGNAFIYNRAVTNVNARRERVYSHSVVNYSPFNRVSYHGGPGGVARMPAPAELAVRRESHTGPLSAQVEHVRNAAADRAQFAAGNHGHPATAALAQPLPAPYRARAAAPENRPAGEVRRGEPMVNGRPEAAPLNRMPPAAARPERGEVRQVPERPAPAARPQMGAARPAPQRPEQRNVQPARPAMPEVRGGAERRMENPAPPRVEAHPAPTQAPHAEPRPQAPPHPQVGPAQNHTKEDHKDDHGRRG